LISGRQSTSTEPEASRVSNGLPSFRPLPLLSSPHAQTIVAMFWPLGRERFPSTHQLVALPDGDKLSVVISTPPAWLSDVRTVVMVHGLCGCYGSPYMSRIAGKLYRRGLRVVRVNLRGCGSGAGLARLPYHSGRSEDIREVLQWLARQRPSSPVTLVGFSLGGNIVLKMAGEDGESPTAGLDSVIAVAAPIDLDACSRLIEQPRNRIYERYFVHRLASQVRELRMVFPDVPPLELPRRLTLRGFDDLYTAPQSGFRDAADYYARASSGPLIHRITVPTLLLCARDDPFIGPAPYEQLPRFSHIDLHLADHGGHLGFLGFTGRSWSYRWMDQCLIDWLQARG
jgi:hypothetical protein